MYHFKFNSEIYGFSLVLFLADKEGDPQEVGSNLDKIFKKYNEPFDNVFFVFPGFILDYYEDLIQDEGFLADSDRVGAPIKYFSFDDFSILKDAEDGAWSDEGKLLDEIIHHGICNLVESREDEVVLKSPPGTVFKKPSNDLVKEFIKASELAVGFDENRFLSFCLMSKRPKGKVGFIWIDTSGISSIVSGICWYFNRFDPDVVVRFDSFNSYAGYKKLKYIKKTDWVIISASTSNNLGVEICNNRRGAKHDNIITMLSCKDTVYELDGTPARGGDRILINITKYSKLYSDIEKFGDDIPVPVIGENFTAQIEAPNRVLLRKPHAPDSVPNFIRNLANSSSLDCHKNSKGKLFEFFFDFSRYYSELTDSKEKFDDWLINSFEWYVPRNLKYLIYDKSDESTLFLVQLLSGIVGTLDDLCHVDVSEIVENVVDDGAALVLSPVISSGRAFLSINRDLRIVRHNQQRTFIAPFAFPSTKNEYDLFSKSLVLGPGNLKYQFLNYKHVFVGKRASPLSWDEELKVIQCLNNDSFKKRVQVLLKTGKGLKGEIGFSTDHSSTRLRFEKDFAFWASGYDSNDVNQSSVYLTVAAILQNLREKPYSLKNKESLFRHVYQHSVIDPENFSRFNDALLQSCLWRVAAPSEVNYSEKCLSSDFAEILLKLAKESLLDKKNAFSDLLIGIAASKIKIEHGELASLIMNLKKMDGLDATAIELIQFIEIEVLKTVEAIEDVPF